MQWLHYKVLNLFSLILLSLATVGCVQCCQAQWLTVYLLQVPQILKFKTSYFFFFCLIIIWIISETILRNKYLFLFLWTDVLWLLFLLGFSVFDILFSLLCTSLRKQKIYNNKNFFVSVQALAGIELTFCHNS